MRQYEVPAGFLFIESGRSVSDHDYLAKALQWLAVEAMRRNTDPAIGETRENFGFVDGISQALVAPSAGGPGKYWSDEVPRGDLLLGYPTSRDSCAVPEKGSALRQQPGGIKCTSYGERLRAAAKAWLEATPAPPKPPFPG